MSWLRGRWRFTRILLSQKLQRKLTGLVEGRGGEGREGEERRGEVTEKAYKVSGGEGRGRRGGKRRGEVTEKAYRVCLLISCIASGFHLAKN